MDAQGPEKARPYVERAGATFTTLVDQAGELAALYGFRLIPNVLLIDQDGVLHYRKFGGFDVLRRPEDRELVERWMRTGEVPPPPEEDSTPDGQAMAYFRRGVELYHQGRVGEALEAWRQGWRLQPDNWLIRKQVWAVEHPERFYQGGVDFDWQKEQIARGQ